MSETQRNDASTDTTNITAAEALETAQRALERVTEVEAQLDEAERELEAMQAQLPGIEARVDALEEQDEQTVERGDHRDQAVLDVLEPGEAVTVRRFRTLYRRHTDLKNSDTISERIRTFTSGPEFEPCGNRVWQYRPERGER